MSSITTTDFTAYPSSQLSPSELDQLEVFVDKLIMGTKKRDQNGKRVDDHRWNPTTFGGGVDIMTIRGVPELLEQHKAQFGINRDPICVLAKAMAEYAGYCGARDRLESRIESRIKAGLAESSSSSSDTSDDDEDASDGDASDDDASDEGENEDHEDENDVSHQDEADASDDDEEDHEDGAEDEDNASNSGSCTSRSVHSEANLITDADSNSNSEAEADSDASSDTDTDGSSAMSFTQCYNTVNIPLPTYTAPDSAAAEADESCSTSSGSSSASSDSMSMSFTPVHVTVRPFAEEHSDVSDTDGERADSPCSTSSNSSSASSDSMSMCFTPVYVASRPIGDVPSKIIGTNDVDDDNESDSCYDESTSSSIVSEQYSPCLYTTGVQATAPRRFRYRGLLPTIIGRPARDFSMRQLDTPSRIPVRTLQVKATHQTATIPAVGSKGRESFPSFVIGGIEPRPAGSIKAPRYKAIKPIVATPHVPWFMRSPPRVSDIKAQITPRVNTSKSSGQRSRIPVRSTPAH